MTFCPGHMTPPPLSVVTLEAAFLDGYTFKTMEPLYPESLSDAPELSANPQCIFNMDSGVLRPTCTGL